LHVSSAKPGECVFDVRGGAADRIRYGLDVRMFNAVSLSDANARVAMLPSPVLRSA